MRDLEVGNMKYLNVAGLTCITSGPAALIGVAFVGTATGQIQFFAGVTSSVSLTPIISFSGTSSAVAGGFSPMFFRMPAEISGNGFTVDLGTTGDPNIILYWVPQPRTP